MPKFPFYRQLDAMDCGPSCLRMVARHYGKSYSDASLREKCHITREGVSLLGVSEAAESIGFRTMAVKLPFHELESLVPLPCIAYWQQKHFVVVYDIKKTRRGGYRVYVADPGRGYISYTREEFCKSWISTVDEGEECGFILALEPRPDFYDFPDEGQARQRRKLRFFFKYLRPFRSQLLQLLLGMLIISILQVIAPFLTQAMVDIGIRNQSLSFITLVLIAQLIIFLVRLATEFIRSWIVLHMNTRINIALISDYLARLMRLPLRYFDTKLMGDIMQRIEDHSRIERFLTGESIGFLFSSLNFIIFSGILLYYNVTIFLIFLLGNTLYILWVIYFMRYRRELDHRRFAQSAGEQSNLIQLISGMQEIKLNNCERQKRWEWERIQVRLFKINIKGLTLGQVQQLGSVFFNQSTSIIITFIAARAVIEGNFTLGMLMALSYIIGQLSGPIEHFIGFVQSLQDASISLERLNEVHGKEDEDESKGEMLSTLPDSRDLRVENVSFSYDGSARDFVLRDINLVIPEKKVTAIVGASGSGKTTLLKLLLGFYPPNQGMIRVGVTPLASIDPHAWRTATGSVMQEGFIFSDTVAKNIALGAEQVDMLRLSHAARLACLDDFLESRPMGFNTRIGMEGNGLSQGQKQRVLIARAVYKNPEYLFLDEATNSLDARNEAAIVHNLQAFYRDKTVVIVAHRLSTVRNADRIVVLDQGKIVEEGTHRELVSRKGKYYQLVQNQLELGL